MLFYLNMKRNASEILESQRQETENKLLELREIQNLVNPIREIFSSGVGFKYFWYVTSQRLAN